jgi:hypothetical protein
MGLFGKKKRDEEFFYNYIMELTPAEMMAMSKALFRYMTEVTQFSTDMSGFNPKLPKKDKDRKEVQ